MTPRQLSVCRAIQAHIDREGVSPTYEELAEKLGIGKVSVYEHVDALIKQGVLAKERNKTRSLRVVRAPSTALRESVKRALTCLANGNPGGAEEVLRAALEDP
jgi:DNA-binding MarR family transcriptional regulator